MAFDTVVAGTTITATWGNTVRDQYVAPFASTSARSSAITAPVNGQVSALTAADSTHGIYQYNGTSWRAPWNLPWGEVASTSYTTIQNTVSTLADLTSLTVTFTAVANRIYEITGRVYLEKSTAASVTVGLYNGSNVLQETLFIDKMVDTDLQVKTFMHRMTLSAGSTTLKLRGSTGTGSFNVRNDAVTGRLLVKDIGPSGAPS